MQSDFTWITLSLLHLSQTLYPFRSIRQQAWQIARVVRIEGRSAPQTEHSTFGFASARARRSINWWQGSQTLLRSSKMILSREHLAQMARDRAVILVHRRHRPVFANTSCFII